MAKLMIVLDEAKAFVQANYQGDPLIRHLYLTLLEKVPKVEDEPGWIPVSETSNCEHKVVTNADRIRTMTDEELAKFIPDWSYTKACKCDEQTYVDCNNECEKCLLDWLQQPAEANDGSQT